jgi:hypothetical protein
MFHFLKKEPGMDLASRSPLTENAVQCPNCNKNSEKDPLAEQLLHFRELREKGEGGS